MKSDRRKYRWKEKRFRDREIKRRQGGVLKHDPLKGSSQAKGIVVEKVGFEAKQPNSGIRKAVKKFLLLELEINSQHSHQEMVLFHLLMSTMKYW